MAAPLAVFLGAFLLFSLELMAAKALLPVFGGAAQVWTAAMMFYQGVLLAGYLYARRPRWHRLLLFAPLLFFPIQVSAAPGMSVVTALLLSIGVPFFVLSTTTPVVQSRVEGNGRDAYHLFAASNAGSLLALLGYPFLFEPFLPLKTQFVCWQALYLLYILTFTLVPGSKVNRARRESAMASSWAERASWILLSAGPSAALLAATNLLSWDLAAVPLLWVLPLSLYLLTFILCFKKEPWEAKRSLFWVAALMGAWLVAALATAAFSSGLPEGWHLARRLWVLNKLLFINAAFFVLAMISHGALSRARPVGRSAEFYACAAAGGWLGSLLIGVALPLLARRSGLIELDWAAAGALSFAALLWAGRERASRPLLAALALALLAGLAFSLKRSVAASKDAIISLRNFYGIYRVAQKDGLRAFYHGNTMHGLQLIDGPRRREPLLYYTRRSPAGEVFAEFGPGLRRAGVVGLGVGSMAAFGRPGQVFDFYELDPDVEALAREWFSYLSDSRAEVSVVVGDGRLALAAREDAAYDLLALDVFSGGAVPVHFLTREALVLYGQRVKPGGLVLVHVTNRFLDLRPVLAALAEDGGWSGAAKMADRSGMVKDEEFFSSWVVLSRDPAKLERLKAKGWSDLSAHGKGLKPWTDGYAGLWSALGG